jgi:hypothetical protein
VRRSTCGPAPGARNEQWPAGRRPWTACCFFPSRAPRRARRLLFLRSRCDHHTDAPIPCRSAGTSHGASMSTGTVNGVTDAMFIAVTGSGHPRKCFGCGSRVSHHVAASSIKVRADRPDVQGIVSSGIRLRATHT